MAKPSGINQAVGEREAYFYDLYRTSKERPPINLLPLRRIKSINKNRINFSFAILPFSFDDVLADAPQRVGNWWSRCSQRPRPPSRSRQTGSGLSKQRVPKWFTARSKPDVWLFYLSPRNDDAECNVKCEAGDWRNEFELLFESRVRNVRIQ